MKNGTTRRDLKFSIWDGSFYSLMVGMGETYLAAYALYVGVDPITTGIIAVGPMLIGAFFQMFSPLGPHYLGSRKAWVVFCAALQGVALAILATVAFFKLNSIVLLWVISLLGMHGSEL